MDAGPPVCRLTACWSIVTNQVYSDNKVCFLISASLGETCVNPVRTCVDTYTVCDSQSGVCECNSSYVQDGSECVSEYGLPRFLLVFFFYLEP